MDQIDASHVAWLLDNYNKSLEENMKDRGANCIKVVTMKFGESKTTCGLKEISCCGCDTTTYFDQNADEDSILCYMQRHIMINHLETHQMTATYVDNENKTPSNQQSMEKLLSMYERKDSNFMDYVERYIKTIMTRGSFCTHLYGLRRGAKMLCPLGKLIRDTLGYRGNRIEIVGRDTFPFYFCSLCLEIFDDKDGHKPHFALKHVGYKVISQ